MIQDHILRVDIEIGGHILVGQLFPDEVDTPELSVEIKGHRAVLLNGHTQIIVCQGSDHLIPDLCHIGILAACPEDTFVIGGESVYTAALDRCDLAYVTKIDKAFEADRYFPDLDADPAWKVVETEGPFQHEDLTFTYVTYKRK